MSVFPDTEEAEAEVEPRSVIHLGIAASNLACRRREFREASRLCLEARQRLHDANQEYKKAQTSFEMENAIGGGMQAEHEQCSDGAPHV